MTTTTSKSDQLEKNPAFKFGPPLIQTAEDAREAYLRGLISEDDLKAALAKYGHSGDHLWYSPSNLERPDDAFERDLPDEFFQQPGVALLKVEDRIKLAEDKEKIREAATTASEKVVADAKPVTDLAELQNKAADKAAEKPEEQFAKDLGKATENVVENKKL